MFKRRPKESGGFSVTYGRDALIYRESGRRMAITIDTGGDQVVLFAISIGRWDDDLMNVVSDEEKQRIAENITRELKNRGLIVNLV